MRRRRFRTITVTTPFISLAGMAADDVAVTSVTWVNNRGGSGTAIGTTSWSVADVAAAAGRERHHGLGERRAGQRRRRHADGDGERAHLHDGGRRDRRVLRYGHPARESERCPGAGADHVSEGRRLDGDAEPDARGDLAHDDRSGWPRRAREHGSVGDGDVDERAAAGRRADDAVGRFELRRAHGEGDRRTGAELVLRGRRAGLLPDLRAAGEPGRHGELGGSAVPARKRIAGGPHVPAGPDVPQDDLRGRHRGRGRQIVRHPGDVPEPRRRGARDVFRVHAAVQRGSRIGGRQRAGARMVPGGRRDGHVLHHVRAARQPGHVGCDGDGDVPAVDGSGGDTEQDGARG